MKLLTTRSVNYLVLQGYDFWKETFLLSFSNVRFGAVRAPFSPIILERRQKSDISPKLGNSHQNYLFFFLV